MPLIRQTIRDLGFDHNRREAVQNRPEIQQPNIRSEVPLSKINQEVPNDSIDWNKASIKTLLINQFIRSGFDIDYNSGTGWWIGIDEDGIAKFFFGNSSGDKITWDGSSLIINGTLTVANGNNLIRNSSFETWESLAATYWNIESGDSWGTDVIEEATEVYFGGSSANIVASSGSLQGVNQNVSSIIKSDKYYLYSIYMKRYGATTVGGLTMDLFGTGVDTPGLVFNSYTEISTDWTRYTLSIPETLATVPSDLILRIVHNFDAGGIYIDGVQLQEVSSTDVTEASPWSDGTYTSIDGGTIQASTILADKLSVTELSAIAANLGTITAGTVTGATIQTSASATVGIKMDSTSLRGYDASGMVSFQLDPTTGVIEAKNMDVASGNLWIPSFLAVDPNVSTSADSYMIGNGDSGLTPTMSILRRDTSGGVNRLYLEKYAPTIVLKSKININDKSGYASAGSAVVTKGCAYTGSSGIMRSRSGGNVNIIRINDAATTVAWTHTVAEIGVDLGVDTDGTNVFFAYQAGGGQNYLRKITLSAGGSASDSSDNANIDGSVGVIYFDSSVWVFSFNSGNSYIVKYNTSLTVQTTVTYFDSSFEGLIVFKLDNTGRVYAMPDGVYNPDNRNIHYIIDLNDF